jgi:very-short-patch-repair endonuclease
MLRGMEDARHVDRNSSGKRNEHTVDRAIGALARRQHGVIARAQLTALGLSADQIDYRLRVGRLHPLYRAVYFTGHGPLAREARFRAAVLAGGTGAALGRRSAAAHWSLPVAQRGEIEVIVPKQRRPVRGLRFHRVALPSDELTVHDGIPVTTVPRTLFDLAAELRPRQLERAFNEAEALRLWDELSLLDLLERYRGRPGGPAIRALLHAHGARQTITRSELERRFLEFLDEFGLPTPETNVLIGQFEVDCLWRDARVVVELDSRAFHDTAVAFERDRERDRLLQVAGWRPVRVTARQLDRSRSPMAWDLRRMLRRPAVTLAA